MTTICEHGLVERPQPHPPYPDCGSGPYSQKLSLSEWEDFNNAQRSHLNFVEGAATALIIFSVAGVFQPRLVAVCGAVYIVGRFLYSLGYTSAGPKGRVVGATLLNLGLLVAFGVGVYSAFNAGGGVAGVTTLIKQIVTLDLLV